jgi:hypothetical protein
VWVGDSLVKWDVLRLVSRWKSARVGARSLSTEAKRTARAAKKRDSLFVFILRTLLYEKGQSEIGQKVFMVWIVIRYWRLKRDADRKAHLVVEKLIQMRERGGGTAEKLGLREIEVSERLERSLDSTWSKKERWLPRSVSRRLPKTAGALARGGWRWMEVRRVGDRLIAGTECKMLEFTTFYRLSLSNSPIHLSASPQKWSEFPGSHRLRGSF